ncbi:MAG: GspE/PulE family protein [Gammaproteobacteria bacterium]|nr:GspE/PulE family protein [Gammaproteobacteria bacterium]
MKELIISNEADLAEVLLANPNISDRHLGEILIQEGQLNNEQLQQALAWQPQHPGMHLGDLLVARQLCSREQINAAMAHKLGIPYVTLDNYEIPPQVLNLVPADIALQYNVLPLAAHNKRLVVAMENPLDWEALELLRFHTNHNIDTVITSNAQISKVLGKYYLQHNDENLDDISDELEMLSVEKPRNTDPLVLQSIAKEARKKPIVRLVNAIITQGIQHRASDINIRPGKDRLNIYYRIDGKLQFSRSMSLALLAGLVSRIKITGRMDIAERRMPQDGHARVSHKGNVVDLRISVIPTINGESVVIRILDKQVGLKPLADLGLGTPEQRKIHTLLSRSYGLLLVTGPTGSGKSTTLYALINEVRLQNPHIITVEDPVEYDMDNIEQIQIAPALGYTFAESLRHILRHDPDVVMIGEIRDIETARIANKAALTGHLVLSTLHTNDAASTVTRLIDMGIEPYLLSSTLLGVMAQRLLRLNCPHCKIEEKVEPEVRQILKLDANEIFFKGGGCSSCNNTGYHGRTVVSELLEITPQLSILISNGANTQTIKSFAQQHGMQTLTQNAVQLARDGITSIEEVFAVRLD